METQKATTTKSKGYTSLSSRNLILYPEGRGSKWPYSQAKQTNVQGFPLYTYIQSANQKFNFLWVKLTKSAETFLDPNQNEKVEWSKDS